MERLRAGIFRTFQIKFGDIDNITVRLYIQQNITLRFMKAKSVLLTYREKDEAKLDHIIATPVNDPDLFSE